jgi:hypothetical protein
MKKVILLLVDSLMPNILEDCMRHRTVPALQFLKDRGRYWSNCVTVFPTMTASVDSSLLTGVFPNEHKIPGLVWYHPEEKAIINYLNGFQCVKRLDISKCAQNVLCNLNEKHLSKQVTTLFEELAQRGKTSAAINVVVHRGYKKHRIRPPFLIKLITRFCTYDDVSGPDLLTLGAMIETDLGKKIPAYLRGFKYFYGVNDQYAISVVKELIQSNQLPDFTMVYLPDNDHEVHKKNPAHAEGALIKVDRHIQEILNLFASWDEALEQCVFIVISDHGQTRIGEGKEYNVDLDQLLSSFQVLPLGGKEVDRYDLVVCNNERMAYVYPLKPDKQPSVLAQLQSEFRIDIIAWKKDQGVCVREGGSGREFYFKPGGPYVDIYGAAWTLHGEWNTLDLHLEQGVLGYGDYPDALSRLYGSLYSQDIPMIVVTARPRYEFLSRFYPTHLGGGSHGSLHKYDSMIPLIVAGSDCPVNEQPRLVDVKYLILNLFASDENPQSFQGLVSSTSKRGE